LLTRQVKNVLIKANKQKDIIGLFGTNSRSKIFSMSHQKKILGIHDINRISYDYIKALHLEKKWKSTCHRKRRNKAVLQRKNVLENILVKLQIWIRMLSFKHSQLQLMHSCITTSRGLSQMARKKRMFFRTFFTWNNTFFATLVHQATKSKSTWAVSHTRLNSCMFMYNFK